MAVRFDSTTDYLYTTSNLLSTTTFTVCVWLKNVVPANTSAWNCGWSYDNGSDGYSLSQGAGNNSSFGEYYEPANPTSFDLYLNPASYGNVYQDAANVWCFLAVTRNGNSGARVAYLWTPLDGWQSATDSSTNSPLSGLNQEQWARALTGDNLNGSLAYFRSWNAVLTEAQLQTERTAATPQVTANLHRVLRLAGASTALTDTSGNGYDVSKGAGTLADDTDPSYVEAVTDYPMAPAVGTLAVTGVAPTLFREFFTAPTVGGLTFTGAAPIVTAAAPYQYVYPTSDISNESWTASAGATLYGCVDEADTPDDGDYIRSPAAPTGQTAVLGLGSLNTPAAGGTVTLRVRARWVA